MTMTRAELIRRLRQIAAQARQAEGIPRNYPYKVGLRTATMILQEPPADRRSCYYDDCEPWDYVSVQDWAREAAPGEIVHLYFWEPGPLGDLVEIALGWIGTDQHPPRLIR